VENNLTWFLHGGKQHGLSDFPFDTANQYKLFLIPDASSNDYDYHALLKEQDIDIVVLDHHEAERISENAIIINNQLSDYPNKHMSGVGVVWQFCSYIDKLNNTNYANDYLDLVALGMDADMMSMTSIETKHLIAKGLKQVQNPFFAAMVDKNSYSMKGKVTPIGVAFYVAPFVNAIVRSGTQEEKELIFNSMLKFRAFDKIPSNKRGHRPGEMEQLYVQAIRTATNVKNRQTRAQDKGLEFLENMIEEYNLLDNKVLLFLLKPGDIDRNIAGLIANKFMAKYQRPCCILTRVEDENGKISYQGSARGCDKTGITEFKDICEQTKRIIFAEGHQGAFGLGIMELDVDDFVEKTNEILKDTSDEALYYVDYIYKNVDVNPQNILDIAELDDLWGKDMDEPQVAIEGLKITKEMLTLMSPDKKPTLKITLPNKVSILKFNSSQEEYEKLYSEHGAVEINLVGSCNRNEWNGYITPQIFIDDYEIIDQVAYVF
jgi:single-stranded-DNA-specific exonuclease